MTLRPNRYPGAGALAIMAALALLAAGAAPAQASPASDPLRAAAQDQGRRILISLEQKQLWLVEGRDTLLSAPVAIGTGEVFQFANRRWQFDTPRGVRRVIGKETEPVWVVPDWNYLKKAADRGLEPIFLRAGDVIRLEDGSLIEVRGDQVGRTDRLGDWWPITPGVEIVADGKIFVPPLNSAQRRVPEALGPYKIDLGNGYLIHGVHPWNEDSIGTRASHGCIRMNNEDVEALYELVSVGTRVYIF
jgi:hypothetical protein